MILHSVITNHSCVFVHGLNADAFSNLILFSTKFDSISEVFVVKVQMHQRYAFLTIEWEKPNSLQLCTKYNSTFSHFSKIFPDDNGKGFRSLSPKGDYMGCLLSCRMAYDSGSKEIRQFQENSLKCMGLMASTQKTTQKTNFNSCATELWKINCKMFHWKTYFT